MKKIISILLTAVLLCTLLSVFVLPASAEDESQTDDPGITWELSEDGKTLTFTGKGAMPNYNNSTYEDRPWHSAAEAVTTVQINPGITALGDYAFCLFGKMTSVTIPESVQSIGVSAFDHCESLTSVTIPSGVTNIGNNAFHSCSSLESVTIPSGVTSIGKSVFGNCSSLTSVMILYGVTSIGSFAFANCTSLESVTIPSSVTGIGNNAFDHCTSLTSITIPYGVKSIDNNAFSYCTNLESVSFPSSIMSIVNGVFDHCSNLTSVTVKAKTPPTWMQLPQLINKGVTFTVYIPDGTSKDYNNGAWGLLVSQKKPKKPMSLTISPEKTARSCWTRTASR